MARAPARLVLDVFFVFFETRLWDLLLPLPFESRCCTRGTERRLRGGYWEASSPMGRTTRAWLGKDWELRSFGRL